MTNEAGTIYGNEIPQSESRGVQTRLANVNPQADIDFADTTNLGLVDGAIRVGWRPLMRGLGKLFGWETAAGGVIVAQACALDHDEFWICSVGGIDVTCTRNE